ncbi:MAG: DUF58 domain-containing protein [Bacteroidetes bacterium]|nr:MAG: DUF58 domain-containing protein [Bacteroidota bacterium]
MPINFQVTQEFSKLELLAKQVVEGFITGLHKSPLHGFSVEFAEHRIYNNGESTKHIDWKLFARTEKLFVKRYEEETNLRCQIVIDCSSSMYYPENKGFEDIENLNKIAFSVYSAASLIQLLKRQRDAVGLSIFSDKVDVHTPAKSSTVHHKKLYTELENLLKPEESLKKTSAAASLHEIAENIHRRSLVIIFSDMMDDSDNEEMFSALQHLRHNNHEIVLFHIVDKSKELDFEFENRPYRFVDSETGEEIKVHPNEIKESYLKSIGDYYNELKVRCGQYKIDFVDADINQGFRQVLLPYLLKRERMF